jgi:hypothetical protein
MSQTYTFSYDFDVTGFTGVATFDLFGFHPGAIYRTSIDDQFRIPIVLPPPPPPRKPVDVKVKPPPRKLPTAPTLAPRTPTIDLKQGEKRRVPYHLQLPPTPTPLDVYFITDSTGSMDGAIASLQEGVQQIINELAATGIDVWFGIGDFRDYPETGEPVYPPTNDGPVFVDGGYYPYLRHRAVGPINAELEEALEGLSTGQGRGEDSALEALYQSATSAGRLRNPSVGPAAGYLIPPNQGAEFRPDAVKVIIVASDEAMRYPGSSGTEATYPGPSHDTVIRALNDKGVEVVGLNVDTPNSGDPRADMERISEGTETLAPAGGIDCDGDGEVDVEQGSPMVCDYTPSPDAGIADAVVNLLQGVRDLATVDVTLEAPTSVARPVGPLSFPRTNVKAYNELPFTVEYRCDKAQAGTETPISLSARVRGDELVTQDVIVRCAASEPVELPPAVLVPPLVAVAAAPPPPPPPAPVSNVQPNTNPNPNPNPQANPQANAQAGAAFEEQQSPQLALATNTEAEVDTEGSAELAMSSLDRRSPDPVPAALAVAATMAMAGAVAHRLHSTHRTATQYATRRRPTRGRS